MSRSSADEGNPGLGLIALFIAGAALVAFLVAFMIYALIYAPINRLAVVYDTHITITDRERIADNDSSKYLVFADQGEFEVTDTMFFWDFGSSARYNQLKPGLTCHVKISGSRWQFMSRYPNIVEIYGCEGAGAGATEIAGDILRRIQIGEIATADAFTAVLRSNAQALGFAAPPPAE